MTPRIEDYALLGDLQTAALLSRDGRIDWLCLPRFDSPACFAALLHDPEAGTWQLSPVDGHVTRRAYMGETLVVETEWEAPGGTVRVIDFMPPRGESADVVRIVAGVSGRVPMRMSLRIRFGYGRVTPWVHHQDDQVAAVAGPDALWLRTPIRVEGGDDESRAEFTVGPGDRVPFTLTYTPSHAPEPEPVNADTALAETQKFWNDWIAQCSYSGPWSSAVRRALVTLKALTYEPTGGILAAATTSLPEQLGGSRNWDYRYCWLRDATFTLQALLGTGFTEEAHAWREWLVRAIAGDPAELQTMYALDGGRYIPETSLDWLSGYEGSTPVRAGNDAAGQFQLDVWGEVLNGLHLARAAGLPASQAAWERQRALLDFLEGHWDRPDNGLWEVRGDRRHFVHSKVMAWTGVDRAIRMASQYGLDAPLSEWRDLRDRIHQDVCARGYDADRGTFTQFYGSSGVDAALLLIPRTGFLPWTDPRFAGTLKAIRTHLEDDGFVRRYDPDADKDVDGLSGRQGSFIACSFWLADALHNTGRTAEARELFEKLLDLRNDIGLLSEEYDTHHKRQIGNTPQGFSMVGLINTARTLTGQPDVAGGHELRC